MSISIDFDIRISNDKINLASVLLYLAVSLPVDYEVLRLSKVTVGFPHSLKIIFQKKDIASNVLMAYGTVIKNNPDISPGVKLVCDKFRIEWELL